MARFRKALLIFGLIVGLAALAAVLWREPLAEAVARRALAANGLDDARLEVVEVGARAIVIEDLSLGPGLPQIRRLRLAYAPGELVSGRIGSLRIEGLRHTAPADLDDALEPLAPLLPGDGGAGWFTLARVEIEDGLITLAGPPGGTVGLDGAFDLSGDAPGAALDIALDLGGATGAFTVRSEALGEGGLVEIDGSGEAALGGVALPGGAALTGGLARYALAGSVRIPALDAGLDALGGERIAALTGKLQLAGVTSAAAEGTLTADIGWALEAGGGAARLTLSRPAILSVTEVPAEALARMGLAAADGAARTLSAELVPSGPLVAWTRRGEGGSVELAVDVALSLGEAKAAARAETRFDHGAGLGPAGPVSLKADIEASDISFARADLAGTLSSGTWSVAGAVSPKGELSLEGPLAIGLRDLRSAAGQAAALRIEGPVRLTHRAGRWTVAADPGLALVAEATTLAGELAFSEPLSLTAETLALEAGGAAPRFELRGRAEPVSGALSGDGEELAFTDAAGGIAVSATLGPEIGGEMILSEAGITLPGHAVNISGLTARLPLGSEGPVALTGRLRDTGRAARFPPLDVTLDGRRSGEAVSFSGAAEGAGIRFPLDGSADLAGAAGRMAVGPTRLSFRRGGLQPGALTSLLPPLADVDGGVRLTADVTFDAGSGLQSSASLDLQDLSLRYGEISVTGLSGRLALARLSPLATAGVQELAARSVTAGVPLEQGRARFSARAQGAGIAVDIREATGTLAGGTVLVSDARWNSAARSNDLEVRVRDVQLSRLLSDWHIEGISGTGRLSGVIPVRVAPAGVVVNDGHLDAAGPGVIQVDWGSARETLMNSGEQVALTVRALEDFHYESLSVGVDQPPEGELSLAIGLEGANPEVLDGHPFRFNINLSGELAPILEAVREGRRIGAGLLSGGLR